MAVVPSYGLQQRDRMVTPMESTVPNLFWFRIKMLEKVKYFIHHAGVALFRLARQSFPTNFYGHLDRESTNLQG